MLPNFSNRAVAGMVGIGLVTLAAAVMLISEARAAGGLTIDQDILATLHTAPLTISGSGFSDSGQITFSETTGSPSTYDLDDTTRFTVTSDTIAISSLPPGVVTGQVHVTVGAKQSNSADLLVYSYTEIPVPKSGSVADTPHSLSIGEDGTVWMTGEFQLEIKSFSNEPTPAYSAFLIPQAPGEGIFRSILFNQDKRSRVSGLTDDLEIAADGSVWFSQGGTHGYPNRSPLYPDDLPSPNFNASRIIRFDPTAESFQCYNSPIDNSEVLGVLVDEARGVLWYSEGAAFNVSVESAITGIRIDSTPELDDCNYDPYTTPTPDLICTAGTPVPQTTDCHSRTELLNTQPAQMVLDSDGNIWFTNFFGNSVGRFDPDTGDVNYLPLPLSPECPQNGTPTPAPPTQPCRIQSAPWQIDFDGTNLWVSQMLDSTVVTFPPVVSGCEALNPVTGENDCMTQVVDNPYPGPDPLLPPTSPDTILFDISVGQVGSDATNDCPTTSPCDVVWYAISVASAQFPTYPSNQIGFVSRAHGNVNVNLPPIEAIDRKSSTHMLLDIVSDPTTGDVWIAMYQQRILGRLQLLHGGSDTDNLDQDGDGCMDRFEVGNDETKGGLRDPLDPWDYYDVRPVVKDGVIDLPNDILGVILNFTGASGYEPGEVAAEGTPLLRENYDRGPSIGGDHWKRSAPDGVIDLPNDILGAILQFTPLGCRE